MNRIFRSNSSTSSRCNQPTSIPDIPADVGAINSETYELSDLDLDIGDWNIPVEKPIALRTRSQSSLDSVQISGKSSKELKELAQQLIAHSQ